MDMFDAPFQMPKNRPSPSVRAGTVMPSMVIVRPPKMTPLTVNGGMVMVCPLMMNPGVTVDPSRAVFTRGPANWGGKLNTPARQEGVGQVLAGCGRTGWPGWPTRRERLPG